MKRSFIYFSLLLLLTSTVCTQSSQNLRLHPGDSKIGNPAEVFYSRVLPSLKGKKVMLVTNPSGIGIDPDRIKKEFKEHNVTISHLIALEHGFLGLEEEFSKTPVSTDPTFQLPIFHIYKIKLSELATLIRETETIVFDVQGMGMRVYTYLTVLKRLMDQSPKGMKIVLIDHIVPTLHLGSRGDFLEKGFENFAGEFPSPVFTGMTLGEAGRFYNGEYLKNKIKLEVIPVYGYKRGMVWEETGIPWHTPSPNLPTLENARNYFSMVFFEGVNVSVGRGTTAPFIYFGAPWMKNPERLASAMESHSKKKFYFTTVYFKPTFGPHTGKICYGLRLNLVQADYDPIELAYNLMLEMRKIYPSQFQWTKWSKIYSIDYLWGSPRFRKAVEKNQDFKSFEASYQAKEKEFDNRAKKYYLY
ncbi:MAG: DUF1343 domain-containing protein [Leptospira sp.]|nr:DUF1343 domain-containing protein [Leptospira sp.]